MMEIIDVPHKKPGRKSISGRQATTTQKNRAFQPGKEKSLPTKKQNLYR